MKKLLIVVDYQNDFVDGTLGFKGALDIENNIINKIKEFKELNDQIIYTLDTHTPDYMHTMEGKNLPIPHCIKGSEGHKLFGKVANELKIDNKTEFLLGGIAPNATSANEREAS